jgi:alpha-L-fucosidase
MLIHTQAGIFAFEPDGAKYRPGEWIVSTLVDVVSKGGLFEVGIGPDANGLFHPMAIRHLEYAGNWIKVNGEAIYGTRPRDQWGEGDHVRFTRSKDHRTAYAIALAWPGRELRLATVRPAPGARIQMLGLNQPLKWRMEAGSLVIELPDSLQHESNRPCRQAWAFRIPLEFDTRSK